MNPVNIAMFSRKDLLKTKAVGHRSRDFIRKLSKRQVDTLNCTLPVITPNYTYVLKRYQIYSLNEEDEKENKNGISLQEYTRDIQSPISVRTL